MKTMIKKMVCVLLLFGFVQTGYVSAETGALETMGNNNMDDTHVTTAVGSMEATKYEELGAALSTMTVKNLNDQAVALEAIWENRRVVLVFLRHFG